MSREDCRASHHDTVRAYYGGCRCPAARKARARFEKGARYDRAHGRMRRVEAVGTLRRVRALWAIGWPSSVIAERAGWCEEQVTGLSRRRYVFTTTARQIAAIYDELQMTPGPSSQTRGRAERAGYAPPLAWDNIDDPDEQPRGMPRSGGMRVAGVAAVWDDLRWEDVDRLRSYGVADEQIAERFGITEDGLQRAEHRYGRAAGTPAA